MTLITSLLLFGFTASAQEPTNPGSSAQVDGKDTSDEVEATPDLSVPKVIHQVLPTWPADVPIDGTEVTVGLRLVVSIAGTVETVEVIRSGGEPFDREAILAAKQLRFEPAIVEGEPIAQAIEFNYGFFEEVAQESSTSDAKSNDEARPPMLTGQVVTMGNRRPLEATEVVVFDSQGTRHSTSPMQRGVSNLPNWPMVRPKSRFVTLGPVIRARSIYLPSNPSTFGCGYA